MSRIWMAIRAFFSVLFLGRLPTDAVAYLPPGESAEPRKRIEPSDARDRTTTQELRVPGAAKPTPAPASPPAATPTVVRPTPASNEAILRTEGALMLLTLLQREGRLLDFLRESLDTYDDAAIGVAVRDIHRDCRKVLDAHLKVEPVMPGDEDQCVFVPRGFDPGEIRLIGKAEGDPPWEGVLVHHGWRVVEAKLPTLAGEVDRYIIAPAEVKLE